MDISGLGFIKWVFRLNCRGKHALSQGPPCGVGNSVFPLKMYLTLPKCRAGVCCRAQHGYIPVLVASPRK